MKPPPCLVNNMDGKQIHQNYGWLVLFTNEHTKKKRFKTPSLWLNNILELCEDMKSPNLARKFKVMASITTINATSSIECMVIMVFELIVTTFLDVVAIITFANVHKKKLCWVLQNASTLALPCPQHACATTIAWCCYLTRWWQWWWWLPFIVVGFACCLLF